MSEDIMSKTKQDECDSCGFDTEVKFYPASGGAREGWLCKLCASSWAGRAYEYPTNYADGKCIRMIALVANLILAKLETMEQGHG